MSSPILFRRLLQSLIVLLLVLSPRLPAQDGPEDATALRDRAFQLVKQGNQIAALPLLEKLAVMRPDDAAVLEKLGGALLASTTDISDPEARKKVVLRARNTFLEARKLGDNSSYLQVMLELTP